MNGVRRSARVAFGMLASLALGGAAPAPTAAPVPDFSGYFVRVGNLWFDPILDDNEGKPITRQDLDGPNADDIWAGDFNNPILQPWASVVDPFGTPHTDKLRVVERYRPFTTPFGKGIEVIVRVEDPGAFTAPWKGMAEYRQDRTIVRLQEIACAENNRSFAEGSTFGTIPQEKTPPF